MLTGRDLVRQLDSISYKANMHSIVHEYACLSLRRKEKDISANIRLNIRSTIFYPTIHDILESCRFSSRSFYLQSTIVHRFADRSLRILQKFAETEQNEDESCNCSSTRRAVYLRLGNLIFELFFNLLRYESSFLCPNRGRSWLLSHFFRDHSSGFCPVLSSSDV